MHWRNLVNGDPIPTLLQKNLKALTSVITSIVNVSLQAGKFGTGLKKAPQRPLLKKAGMDLCFSNFALCPTSRTYWKYWMSSMSTVHYFTSVTGNTEPLPSSFKAGHSIETALLKVQDDILKAILLISYKQLGNYFLGIQESYSPTYWQEFIQVIIRHLSTNYSVSCRTSCCAGSWCQLVVVICLEI